MRAIQIVLLLALVSFLHIIRRDIDVIRDVDIKTWLEDIPPMCVRTEDLPSKRALIH